MSNLFPTYEVGSLPKLNARVRAIAGKPENPVTEADLDELVSYARIAQVDCRRVLEMLGLQKRHLHRLSPEEKTELVDFNALLNLKLQEKAGLDYVYDGEARRSEMYHHVSSRIVKFLDLGEMARSRGPDSWKELISIGEPSLSAGSLDDLIIKELNFVNANASFPVKVPIDDPYMIANMTLDKYFKEKLKQIYPDEPQSVRYEAKRALTLALARNVIRPQVEAAANAGANWIQLDIPSATIDPGHIPIFVEGINETIKGIDNVKFSLHLCYPRRMIPGKNGYELLFPDFLNLDSRIDHLSLELANGNQYRRDLAPFIRYRPQRTFEIGLGVIDITQEKQKQNLIETPEQIRDRIILAANVLKHPELIYVAPDCGLRQLTLERSLRLYDVMLQGTELARRG